MNNGLPNQTSMDVNAVAVNPEPAEDEVFVFPCTYAQQGFWLLDQLQPGNPACNIAIRFELTGPLQVSVLRDALNAIVGRHESLRTTIATVDGSPVQVIQPELTVDVAVHQLAHLRPSEKTKQASRLTDEAARERFNISEGPLIRVSVLEFEPRRHNLLVTIHRTICDGWSTGVFIEELAALYEAILEDKPSPLQPLPIQFADYAAWEEENRESTVAASHFDYWRRRLDGAKVLNVPTNGQRRRDRLFQGAIHSVLLSKLATDRLRQWSHGEENTLFISFLTAFKMILANLCNQDDIVIGCMTAGRNQVELEPLIGLFANTLALRTDLSGNPSFREAAKRVGKTVMEAFEHQNIPFDRLLKELSLPRAAGMNALRRVNFICQRAFLNPLQFGGLSLTPIPSVSAGAIHDLSFFLVEREEGWRASIEHNPDVLDEEVAQTLLSEFQRVVEQACADPTRTMDELVGPNQASHLTTPVLALGPSEPHANPATATEERLASIWQDVLQTGPISVRSNFFELGGHSFHAAQIALQIEKQMKHRFPLAQFFSYPTVETMAAALELGVDSQNTASLVVLQEGKARPPLFIVHGVGGNVVGFHPLVRQLGPDQPVYALQSRGLGDATPTLMTVQEMAALYIEQIKTVQPEGPYNLIGYSAGGMICFEMAQQLHAAREAVSLLSMLDTVQFYYWESRQTTAPLTSRLQSAPHGFRQKVNDLVEAPNRSAYLREKVRSKFVRTLYPIYRRFRTLLPQWLASVWDVKVAYAYEPGETQVEKLNWFAIRGYRPKPYPGPVVLFRADDKRLGQDFPDHLGWAELALGGVKIVHVPGNHRDMLREPNVQRLSAEVLRLVTELQPS